MRICINGQYTSIGGNLQANKPLTIDHLRMYVTSLCADPESIVRGGPTITTFILMF